MTPALTNSSLYFPISVRSLSSGTTPASVSGLAFSITMNRIFDLSFNSPRHARTAAAPWFLTTESNGHRADRRARRLFLPDLYRCSSRRQSWYLHYRADLDGTNACRRNLSGNADRLIQIFGFDQKKAAQLLACFRKWSVRDHSPAFTYLNACRRRRRLQRRSSKELTARLQLMRKLGRLSIAVLPLRLA